MVFSCLPLLLRDRSYISMPASVGSACRMAILAVIPDSGQCGLWLGEKLTTSWISQEPRPHKDIIAL